MMLMWYGIILTSLKSSSVVTKQEKTKKASLWKKTTKYVGAMEFDQSVNCCCRAWKVVRGCWLVGGLPFVVYLHVCVFFLVFRGEKGLVGGVGYLCLRAPHSYFPLVLLLSFPIFSLMF